MIAILAAVLAMAAKDALGTFLVVAEAKGRAHLAGLLDCAGDLANLACTVIGAGAVIRGGITAHTAALVVAMMATSYVGTAYWTKLGRRIETHEEKAGGK